MIYPINFFGSVGQRSTSHHAEVRFRDIDLDLFVQVAFLHCVSQNAPTLDSYNFNKHEIILIIFGKQHQHFQK